jgi:hypothetical protein
VASVRGAVVFHGLPPGVTRADKEPHDLCQYSHLNMKSLMDRSIGDAGARDLGAALQVNTTLTALG